MAKVVTMGEIMLRLSSSQGKRFVQSDAFDVVYGGGEANVAVSLANFGHESYFVTKLPKHEIGQAAVNELRRYGVKDNYIVRGGERVGIYFLETGSAMRPSKVIYDRSNSAISLAEASEFDFDAIFNGAKWFHFTGITPAISKKAAKLIEAALVAAKRQGVTVSVDLNYRKKLWTSEEACAVMTNLMQYVDVCLGNEEDFEKCLGEKLTKGDVTKGVLDLNSYKELFERLQAKYHFKYIATSLRESYSASDNGWSALIYDGHDFQHSQKYTIHITDRVGAGDSFAAGLIHGLISGKNAHDAICFAVGASALKHTIFGDFNMVNADEVENLVKGDASGRVQR